MTLTDGGPLIAILDRRDPDHIACTAALRGMEMPLVTTLPAVAELFHFLRKRSGWSGQRAVWDLIDRSDVRIDLLDDGILQRIPVLMEKYRDTPMSLADASLVALAEARGFRRVFTLDSDFHGYRLNGKIPFQVIP